MLLNEIDCETDHESEHMLQEDYLQVLCHKLWEILPEWGQQRKFKNRSK